MVLTTTHSTIHDDRSNHNHVEQSTNISISRTNSITNYNGSRWSKNSIECTTTQHNTDDQLQQPQPDNIDDGDIITNSKSDTVGSPTRTRWSPKLTFGRPLHRSPSRLWTINQISHNKRQLLKKSEALRLLLSPDNLQTIVYTQKTATNLPRWPNNSGDHSMSSSINGYHGNNSCFDKLLGHIIDFGRQHFSYTPNVDSSSKL